MVKSLGETIALYDNKIKERLTNIINNKEAIINEYKELKHILPRYNESKRKIFEKLLNTRKQQFEHTLNLKNCSSFDELFGELVGNKTRGNSFDIILLNELIN